MWTSAPMSIAQPKPNADRAYATPLIPFVFLILTVPVVRSASWQNAGCPSSHPVLMLFVLLMNIANSAYA